MSGVCKRRSQCDSSDERSDENQRPSKRIDRKDHMEWLYDTSKFSDCHLLIGTSTDPFKVHINIITRCSFFRSIFETSPFNTFGPEVCTIQLPDENKDDFERLLRFLYTNDYPYGKSPFRSIYRHGHRGGHLNYDVVNNNTREKEYTEADFAKNFDHLRIYTLASRFGLPKLQRLAIQAIQDLRPWVGNWTTSIASFAREVYKSNATTSWEIKATVIQWAFNTIEEDIYRYMERPGRNYTNQGDSDGYNPPPDAVKEFFSICVGFSIDLSRKMLRDLSDYNQYGSERSSFYGSYTSDRASSGQEEE